MSSAAVSQRPPTTAEGDTKRRSLFKPSTWKKSSREQAHDAVEHAGVDAPNGRSVTGLNTIDGVETGAPLTSLTGGQGEATTQQPQSGPSNAPQPPSTQPIARAVTPPTSGIPHEVDPLGRILFFRQDAPNYHLSNSSPHYPVYFNNVRYATSEHLFQSLKFPSHPEIASKVRRAKSPTEAMRIARSHTDKYPAGWFSDGLNVKVMHDVVLAKFSQWGRLREALLETEERELVNDSPTDVFWGTGAAGTGRNVLGKVLMDVREVLRVNAGVAYGSGAKTM